MASAQLATQTPSAILIIMLVALLVMGVIQVFALYLHLARFTFFEIILLLALPLFLYLIALPAVASALLASGVVALKVIMDIPRLLDVPLLHFGNATLAFNLVGFSIPVFISAKMLLQKRIPVKESLLLVAIISVVSYLYTRFEPDKGMVIYMFAIPPILAAAIAFMYKKMKGTGTFNPALMSYAGATLGILIGADVSNFYQALTHQWDEAVFISIGGGSIMDAIFLAGVVALFADFVFESQEENITGRLIKLFISDRHR